MKSLLICIVISTQLVGCGMFSKKPAPAQGNPLAVSNCPNELPPLTDDTFGGANKKIVEISEIYFKCALSGTGAK